jgi:hypothetical protein
VLRVEAAGAAPAVADEGGGTVSGRRKRGAEFITPGRYLTDEATNILNASFGAPVPVGRNNKSVAERALAELRVKLDGRSPFKCGSPLGLLTKEKVEMRRKNYKKRKRSRPTASANGTRRSSRLASAEKDAAEMADADVSVQFDEEPEVDVEMSVEMSAAAASSTPSAAAAAAAPASSSGWYSAPPGGALRGVLGSMMRESRARADAQSHGMGASLGDEVRAAAARARAEQRAKEKERRRERLALAEARRLQEEAEQAEEAAAEAEQQARDRAKISRLMKSALGYSDGKPLVLESFEGNLLLDVHVAGTRELFSKGDKWLQERLRAGGAAAAAAAADPGATKDARKLIEMAYVCGEATRKACSRNSNPDPDADDFMSFVPGLRFLRTWTLAAMAYIHEASGGAVVLPIPRDSWFMSVRRRISRWSEKQGE